jgi:serine/threonine-protein kinase
MRGQALGRYLLYDEIASGGMASVHLARLVGPVGFSRTVAIKRLHPQLAKDPEFVTMFVDEARLAARVSHPNVVPTLDVVSTDGELFIVMEFVRGVSLAHLKRAVRQRDERIPVPVALAILGAMLDGLHAAHEAADERGASLGIVHRDVSPQNVLVGADGVARLVDFGVAKAIGRLHETTRDGRLKGKLAYMSPEQLRAQPVDRRADVFSASVVAWELLSGRRLFTGNEPGALMHAVLFGEIAAASSIAPELDPRFDAVLAKGLARDPQERWQSADELARALEAIGPTAPARDVARWVEQLAGETLAERTRQIASVESRTDAVAAVSRDPPRIEDGPITEISGVADPVRARKRSVTLFGAVALVALIGTILVLVASPRARPVPDATSAGAAQAPSFEPQAPPSAPIVQLPAPSTSASTAAAPARTSRPRAAPPTIKPQATPCKSVPPGCNPPWQLAADGRKRFKPECSAYLSCF